MDEYSDETETQVEFAPMTAEEFIDRYTHCALCGSSLHFQHATDFVRNLTEETARCPECGVRASRTIHALQ